MPPKDLSDEEKAIINEINKEFETHRKQAIKNLYDMVLQYVLLATINADIVVRDEDVH